jgi:O-methyltransferase
MFPDSLGGFEDRFAFVSLDVDLYEPTLAGLRYFYPRLSLGGFIFIHDYNNRRYMGVRQAVADFLGESHAPALPLPDFAGTLVVLR